MGAFRTWGNVGILEFVPGNRTAPYVFIIKHHTRQKQIDKRRGKGLVCRGVTDEDFHWVG
jgi:hypothetical protein